MMNCSLIIRLNLYSKCNVFNTTSIINLVGNLTLSHIASKRIIIKVRLIKNNKLPILLYLYIMLLHHFKNREIIKMYQQKKYLLIASFILNYK